MIEQHYMLVTKDSCPYCKKALDLLKEQDCSFAYTDMNNAQKLLDITMKQINWETVPMIWAQTIEWSDEEQPVVVENKFVGGYAELTELLEVSVKDD